MKRLKNQHRDARAAIIFGGPSLLDKDFDFQAIRDRNCVIFLETQALTPWFLEKGVQPDYYLMQFPDKCHGNSLHNYIFRSFLAGVDPRWFFKQKHRAIVTDMKSQFDKYFDPWRPQKGPHKAYRWKPGTYLPDSPYDVMKRLGGQVKILANEELLGEEFPDHDKPHQLFLFKQSRQQEAFDLNRYYNPDDSDELLTLRNVPFFNSVAIGLYPLLRYMGFKEIFFFGMDMSMLGSFEFAAPYSFKSMWHFRAYFWRTNHVFNANYILNRPYYLRPQYEFDEHKQLLDYPALTFTRVHDPFHWSAPTIDGLSSISFNEFLTQ